MCHSDEHLRTGDASAPLPMVGGHEGAGVVEAVGPGSAGWQVGDHVVCSFIPACGLCRYCSTGRAEPLRPRRARCRPASSATAPSASTPGRHRTSGGCCMLGTFAAVAVVTSESRASRSTTTSRSRSPRWSAAACPPAGARRSTRRGAGRRHRRRLRRRRRRHQRRAGRGHAGAEHVVAVDPVAFKREKAKEFGATHVFASVDEAQGARRRSTRGQMADHAIVTVGVLSGEIVAQAHGDRSARAAAVALTSRGQATTSRSDSSQRPDRRLPEEHPGPLFG